MSLSYKNIAGFQKNLNLPLISLLIANALPVVGVLFFGWDAFAIVLLYWTENIAVGFYNVLKMLFVKIKRPRKNEGKLFLIPFFIVHYGIFTAVHGAFVFSIFRGEFGQSENFQNSPLLSGLPLSMYIAFICLFISHGISFVRNYFYKGERNRTSMVRLMHQPYGRIVVLHLAVMSGGFLTAILGSPIMLLLTLVLLKTIVDVKLHLRERKKNQ